MSAACSHILLFAAYVHVLNNLPVIHRITQDLWNARGVSYSIPQYSLLYSEEQAIAMMLQTCTQPWALTSTADVHGLYCRQLGQVRAACVCVGADSGHVCMVHRLRVWLYFCALHCLHDLHLSCCC